MHVPLFAWRRDRHHHNTFTAAAGEEVQESPTHPFGLQELKEKEYMQRLFD